jgi:hypothetical protein
MSCTNPVSGMSLDFCHGIFFIELASIKSYLRKKLSVGNDDADLPDRKTSKSRQEY